MEFCVHDAERVRVRIPGWVDKATVRVEVNAKGVEPAWSERYLGLEKLKAGDAVTVRFDVSGREVERDFGWRKYTLQFKGSTLADIQPRPKEAGRIPLFPPERHGATKPRCERSNDSWRRRCQAAGIGDCDQHS